MYLIFKISGGQELNFEFKGPKATLGRQNTCDIVIPHNEVSRQHMLIEVKGDEVFVTDLDSKNGIVLAGTKIKPQTRTAYTHGAPMVLGAAGIARITPIVTGPLHAAGTDAGNEMTRTVAMKPGAPTILQPTLELEERPVFVPDPKKNQNLGKLYEGVHEEKIEEEDEEEVSTFKQKLPGIILVILVCAALYWWKSQK